MTTMTLAQGLDLDLAATMMSKHISSFSLTPASHRHHWKFHHPLIWFYPFFWFSF